jgi:hypothetical protein
MRLWNLYTRAKYGNNVYQLPNPCALIAIKDLYPKLSHNQIISAFTRTGCYSTYQGCMPDQSLHKSFDLLGIKYEDHFTQSPYVFKFTYGATLNDFKTAKEWFDETEKNGRKFVIVYHTFARTSWHATGLNKETWFGLHDKPERTYYIGHYNLLD